MSQLALKTSRNEVFKFRRRLRDESYFIKTIPQPSSHRFQKRHKQMPFNPTAQSTFREGATLNLASVKSSLSFPFPYQRRRDPEEKESRKTPKTVQKPAVPLTARSRYCGTASDHCHSCQILFWGSFLTVFTGLFLRSRGPRPPAARSVRASRRPAHLLPLLPEQRCRLRVTNGSTVVSESIGQ